MQTEPLETPGIICVKRCCRCALLLLCCATTSYSCLLVHAYIYCPGDEGRPPTPQSFPNQLLADPVATSFSLGRKRCLLSCGTRYRAASSVAIADQQQREGWSCRNGAAAAAAVPSIFAWTSTTLRAGVYLGLVVLLLPRVSPDRAEARKFWRWVPTSIDWQSQSECRCGQTGRKWGKPPFFKNERSFESFCDSVHTPTYRANPFALCCRSRFYVTLLLLRLFLEVPLPPTGFRRTSKPVREGRKVCDNT